MIITAAAGFVFSSASASSRGRRNLRSRSTDASLTANGNASSILGLTRGFGTFGTPQMRSARKIRDVGSSEQRRVDAIGRPVSPPDNTRPIGGMLFEVTNVSAPAQRARVLAGRGIKMQLG